MPASYLWRRVVGSSALALAIALLGGGCDSEEAWGPAGPGGSNVSIGALLIASSVLQPGESTAVSAWVLQPDESPAVGVVVEFGQAGHGNQGSFSPSSVATDSTGLARSAFHAAAQASGRVDLKAKAGGDVDYATLYVFPAGDASLAIQVTASELAIPADGRTTSELTIHVQRDGAPAARQVVKLAAGELFSDRDHDGDFSAGDELLIDADDDGAWDGMGSVTSPVVTDSAGIAVATYTAGLEEGTVYVKAQVDTVAVDLEITLHSQQSTIALTAMPSEVWADGYAAVTIHARVTDWRGRPLGGKHVRFTAGEPFTDDDGDGYYSPGEPFSDQNANGEWDVCGTIASAATTDAAGELAVNYTSGRCPGTVTISGSTGESRAQVALQLVALPRVARAEWAWSPDWLYANGLGQATLAMTLYDVNGSPLPGKTVALVADRGAIEAACVADENGTLHAIFTAPATAGTATVTVAAEAWSQQIPLAIAELPQLLSVRLAAGLEEICLQGSGGQDRVTLEAGCLALDGMSAPPGVPVLFAIASGPGGGEVFEGTRGESQAALTGADGVATAVLRAGTLPGVVRVTATSGALVGAVEVGVSVGPPATLSIRAQDDELAEWEETVIEVVVHDAYHNPVKDGTVIYFTADEGSIYTPSGSGTARTLAGAASATYVALLGADRQTDRATITARTEGGVSGQTTILLPALEDPAAPAPIARLELLPGLPEIGVHGTGAVEQCVLTAVGYDAEEQPVGRSQAVVFEITAGPGGGENLEGQGWGPLTAYTDDAGQARVALRSGTISGTVRVECRADTLASRSALVSIAAGPPQYISLGIDPLNIRGWDVVGAEAEILALVSDIYGNPVRDGTTVYFTCDEGLVRGSDGHLGSAVTMGGAADAFYLSGQPRLDGRVTVTASTAGGTVSEACGLISSGPPTSLEFVSPLPPVYLVADGEDSRLLTVEVLDINDNFVIAGTEVRFRTDLGVVTEIALTADGVYGSVAQADLTSEILGRDYSYSVPDDGIGGVACVAGRVGLGGWASDTLAVHFLTGAAYRGNSRIAIEASVDAGATVPFEIEIKDRPGNPLGGHVLSLSASGGALVSAVATTDAWGTAPALFTAPANDTICVVTAVDGDPGFGGGLILTARVTVSD